MAGINKVILIGNLGKDPEVRSLEGGAKVATFTLATTEYYKKDGQRTEQTEWHNIVLWRGLADIAEQYLHKGNTVYIEGKIRNRKYEKDGQTRYISEIVADNLTMLGGKKDQSPSDESANFNSNPESVADMPADDLPF